MASNDVPEKTLKLLHDPILKTISEIAGKDKQPDENYPNDKKTFDDTADALSKEIMKVSMETRAFPRSGH